MICEDQAAVVACLGSPATHGGAPVERIETHASIVFLAGRRALKLKRAVRYDYLDFSTAERRREMCEAEVRINRRTAPALYRGVLAVTLEPDGSLALAGPGEPVDWVVEMARFDQAGLFDRLAARGALALELMRPLGATIAGFHKGAAPRRDRGGSAGMDWVLGGNATGFAVEGERIFDPGTSARIINRTRDTLARHSVLLDARRDAGFVRQCHGDLHLRNIVLVDGQPLLFDAIEFNDDIACIDVLYDLAFLLMDLWRRHLPGHANAVWNSYLSETLDLDGLPLLPLFLSSRASVRAKTSAAAAGLQRESARRAELQTLARGYLAMADDLLQPAGPCLVAVGGFSGSGKSTLARAIAPAIGSVPGAVVIRSDEVRKKLCGAPATERLGPDAYTPEVTRRVYAIVAQMADSVVRNGQAAVVDAVLARSADREAIQHTAFAAGVPFVGLWLDAPEPVLVARAEDRRFDASDAGAAAIRAQLAEPTGAIHWHRLDASGPEGSVLDAATTVLSECRPAARQ